MTIPICKSYDCDCCGQSDSYIGRHCIPDIDEKTYNEMIGEDYVELHSSLKASHGLSGEQPRIGVGTHHKSSAFGELNYNDLIEMRLQHQTRQAATGVRTKTSTQLLSSSKTTSVNNNEHDEDDPTASRTKILKSIVQ